MFFACIQAKIGYYGRHLVFVFIFIFMCSLLIILSLLIISTLHFRLSNSKTLGISAPSPLFSFSLHCSVSSAMKIIIFIHFVIQIPWSHVHMGMLDNFRPSPASFVSSISYSEESQLGHFESVDHLKNGDQYKHPKPRHTAHL